MRPRSPGAFNDFLENEEYADRPSAHKGFSGRAAVRVSCPDPGEHAMCRNIKTLFNFDPPATDDEVREASLQFVRKLSGFTKPSRANEAAFHRAVKQMTAAARNLLDSLVTDAEPRNRDVEAARARARAVERFGSR
jgi:hypothetical protein